MRRSVSYAGFLWKGWKPDFALLRNCRSGLLRHAASLYYLNEKSRDKSVPALMY
jgi:hypothetical protein